MTIMNRSLDELRSLSHATEPKKAALNDPRSSEAMIAAPQKPKEQTKKKQKKPKLKKLKKRPRTEPSTLSRNAVASSNVTAVPATFASVENALEEAFVAVAETSSYESESPSNSQNKKKKRTDDSSNATCETSSLSNSTTTATASEPHRSQTDSKDTTTSQHATSCTTITATEEAILPRQKLWKRVQDLDLEAKGEFAWKYHGRQSKKGQTQFWYSFRPHEKYCADHAFVPLQYTSLLPSGTPKNQIKRKTTALVLEKGVRGIHFAIGWGELCNLIVENGVFAAANDADDEDEDHPTLIDFRPPSLDPFAKVKSPTKGIRSILAESSKSRKATLGKKKYTTTPSPQEEETLLDSKAGPTLPVVRAGTKRKASTGAERIIPNNNNTKRNKTKHAKKANREEEEESDKQIEIATTRDQPKRPLLSVAKKPSKRKRAGLREEEEDDGPNYSASSPIDNDTALQQLDPLPVPSVAAKEGSVAKKSPSKPKLGLSEKAQSPSNNKALPLAHSPPPVEEEPYKWANWRPSAPPTPPVEYWIELYGATDV